MRQSTGFAAGRGLIHKILLYSLRSNRHHI
jgi:hypothetical protein